MSYNVHATDVKSYEVKLFDPPVEGGCADSDSYNLKSNDCKLCNYMAYLSC